MISFLIFLVGAMAIAFGVGFFASRSLLDYFPERRFVAVAVSVLLALAALFMFHAIAEPLISVRASGPDMGGLAWVLNLVSYVVAISLTLPCLVIGIVRGMKQTPRDADRV